MRATALLAFLAAVLALAMPAASRADDQPGCGADECIGSTPVVPSLDPEWSANFVPPPVPRIRAAAAACIPTDVVFYAPTDWVRIAQKMRANMSLCANYFVSIPPIATDKTKPRGPLQPTLIRALGPNFHAVNEINVTDTTSWSAWVASGKGTWYQAGVEARRRMEDPAQGNFDVAAGDIWAVNELTSAVRAGTGASRQNMRDFVHGLYDGADGIPVKGLVWISNFGQGTTFFDTYRGNVKAWLSDQAFWADMSQYVRFVSPEVYGRVASWAVPGTAPQDRLTPTADYLEHFVHFAGAGAYDLGDTASYLAGADAPVGNASWSSPTYEWPSPAVDYTLAAAYAAGQVYAFRHDQDGRPSQAFGFAWSPTNPGLTTADFNTKSGFIADRIAAAIHASDAPSADPGLAACGTDLAWCTGDLPGATFNTAWRMFHDWTQPTALATNAVVQENAAGQVALSAIDPDPGQQLTFSIVTQPLHGTIVTDGSSAVTYTPNADYTGQDTFTFRANDGWLNSNVATVTLKVNAPPVVDAGADVSTQWDVPATLSGTATDPDGDSNALVARWDFGDGSTGMTLQATHAYADPGTYTAQLTVTDADKGVATDTATVTVGPRQSSLTVNTKPTLDVSTAIVAAQLADAVDAPSARLKGHDVTFSAGGANCTASTDANGDASCTLPAAALALGPSALTVRFDGDTLYSASTAEGHVVIYGMPTGGVFAVGDLSATGAVTFWSSAWWVANTLSGGSAPPSFKGFVQPTRTGWTAAPGLDGVPATVPEWMGVIVTTAVTKDKEVITGDQTRFVVVHVNTYDPALVGQGTVVADAG
jgi:PKD repeat protein